MTMLVLTRKIDEQLTIGDDVTIIVISVHGNRVRLAIQAPTSCKIVRASNGELSLEKAKYHRHVPLLCVRDEWALRMCAAPCVSLVINGSSESGPSDLRREIPLEWEP